MEDIYYLESRRVRKTLDVWSCNFYYICSSRVFYSVPGYHSGYSYHTDKKQLQGFGKYSYRLDINVNPCNYFKNLRTWKIPEPQLKIKNILTSLLNMYDQNLFGLFCHLPLKWVSHC